MYNFGAFGNIYEVVRFLGKGVKMSKRRMHTHRRLSLKLNPVSE